MNLLYLSTPLLPSSSSPFSAVTCWWRVNLKLSLLTILHSSALRPLWYLKPSLNIVRMSSRFFKEFLKTFIFHLNTCTFTVVDSHLFPCACDQLCFLRWWYFIGLILLVFLILFASIIVVQQPFQVGTF